MQIFVWWLMIVIVNSNKFGAHSDSGVSWPSFSENVSRRGDLQILLGSSLELSIEGLEVLRFFQENLQKQRLFVI